jgi:thiol:disulfide interchange protein DsbD
MLIMGLAVGGGVRLTAAAPIEWIAYTPERLQQAAAARQVAVVVFTAEWCLNCKAIEQNVFAAPKIISLLRRPEVAPIKVDLTGHNPAGRAKLRALGHLTIPLLVVLGPDGGIVFKSDFYTADQLADAVAVARSTAGSAAQ